MRLPLAAVLWLILASLTPGVARAQDPNGFRGLPSLVCVDRRTSPFCEKQRGAASTKAATLAAAMPESPYLPMIACELPDAPGPCSVSVCGDKVCAFGERGQCALDCPVPAKVEVCTCEPGGCKVVSVDCDQAGCQTAAGAAGDACKCKAPDGAQTCTAEPGKMCLVMRFAAPVVGCELVRFNTGARRSYARCTHESCPPPGFGLSDVEELPPVDKAAVEGPK